jgi:hypothetical protein
MQRSLREHAMRNDDTPIDPVRSNNLKQFAIIDSDTRIKSVASWLGARLSSEELDGQRGVYADQPPGRAAGRRCEKHNQEGSECSVKLSIC